MTTPVKKLFVLSLMAAITLSACKKNDGSTDTMPTDSTSVSNDSLNMQAADTTAMPADTSQTANGTTLNTPTGHNESAGAVTRRASREKASAKNNLNGYGAPNGSDAENHDGDQYTKNNERPMPSGSTSMK